MTGQSLGSYRRCTTFTRTSHIRNPGSTKSEWRRGTEAGASDSRLRAALGVGRRLGCEEAWVLTNRSNEAAMRLYASSGGEAAPQDAVMFTFHLDAGDVN